MLYKQSVIITSVMLTGLTRGGAFPHGSHKGGGSKYRAKQSTNKSTNKSTDKSTSNQPINQPIYWLIFLIVLLILLLLLLIIIIIVLLLLLIRLVPITTPQNPQIIHKQPNNRSNQSIKPIDQPDNRSKQSINQTIDQINRSTNQQINQSPNSCLPCCSLVGNACQVNEVHLSRLQSSGRSIIGVVPLPMLRVPALLGCAQTRQQKGTDY